MATTKDNFTTCPQCRKWTVQDANYCHHCAQPLKAQFESTVTDPGPVTVTPRRGSGFFNSDAAKWIIAVAAPPCLGVSLAWLNGYEPGAGATLATVVFVVGGGGLLLARWYFERPTQTEPKPERHAITVTMHEPLPSGWKTYLDEFTDPSISADDLHLVAKSVLASGSNFSREAMVKGGLSQPKARRVQQEFLRLHYACPLPNGKPGYTLTMRGRKLLAELGRN